MIFNHLIRLLLFILFISHNLTNYLHIFKYYQRVSSNQQNESTGSTPLNSERPSNFSTNASNVCSFLS